MNKKDFPALTGIRFIAASLVYVFHYAQIMYGGKPLDFWYYFMRQLNIGVNLFFVLSGFLIAHRYYSLGLGYREFAQYWWKRIVRILPLYYAVLGFQLLMLYRHHAAPDAVTIFLNVTLLKGLSDKYFFSVMTQSWSLTVEEIFYVYAPFAFYLIKQKRLFFLQIVCLLAVGFLLVAAKTSFHSPSFFGDVRFLFAGTFFGRCFEFFTGIYVALLVRSRKTEATGIRMTVSGALLFCFFLCVQAFYAYHKRYEAINEYPFGVLLFNFFIPASIGLLFYGLVTENSWLKKLLSTKSITLLGKSSYAFYLLHIGALAEVIYFHFTSNILLLYVLLQLCSIAAYKFFEKPVYFYLLRLFTKPYPRTAR